MLEVRPVAFQVPITVPAVPSRRSVTEAVPVLLVGGTSPAPVSSATSVPAEGPVALVAVGETVGLFGPGVLVTVCVLVGVLVAPSAPCTITSPFIDGPCTWQK